MLRSRYSKIQIGTYNKSDLRKYPPQSPKINIKRKKKKKDSSYPGSPLTDNSKWSRHSSQSSAHYDTSRPRYIGSWF